MTNLPKFSIVLFHPHYWSTQLDTGILWLVMQLPYPVIYRLDCELGKLASRFMKRRARIAYHNLELCFPGMSEQEHHRMVVKNSESVDAGLMEIGMVWLWPDRRIAHQTEVTGMEYIRGMQAQRRSILLVGVRFLILGLGTRQFGMQEPGIGVCRPNDGSLIDQLQARGCLRSNRSMFDHKDLKGMIKVLKKDEMVWYAPDHDYGPCSSTFVPLFAVEQAATTTGTWMLTRVSGAYLVPFVPRRKSGGKGYQLIILPPECSPPLNGAEATVA